MSNYFRHKKVLIVTYLEYGPKLAQILKSDFCKPQNWETYLSNLPFLTLATSNF